MAEEAKWIKVMTDIFDDEKMKLIASMPDGDSIQLLWVKMLCMAGKKNNGGVFSIRSIPYTEDMLSTVLCSDPATVRAALEAFESLGMTDRTEDGAVRIVNWNKHQSMDALERKRELTKARVETYRQNKLAAHDVTQSSVTCNADVTQDVTLSSVTSNADVTLCNATDKRREDKNREDKIREDTPKGVYAAFAAGDSRLEDALNAFEEMRTRIKAPLTDRARSLILSTLETFPRTEWVDVLNQSTANGWKSLRAVERPKAPAPAASVQPNKYAASASDIDAMRRLHDHLAGSQ